MARSSAIRETLHFLATLRRFSSFSANCWTNRCVNRRSFERGATFVVWGESMGLVFREMQGVCGVWGKYIGSLV